MDIDGVIKIALFAVLGIVVLYEAVRFGGLAYRMWRRDRSPVETARAVVYHKEPDFVPMLIGRASTNVYYVVFHTDDGEILRLYMTRDDYFSLEEDTAGMLTWQDDKFWRFQKEG